jgi:hypothetical protein
MNLYSLSTELSETCDAVIRAKFSRWLAFLTAGVVLRALKPLIRSSKNMWWLNEDLGEFGPTHAFRKPITCLRFSFPASFQPSSNHKTRKRIAGSGEARINPPSHKDLSREAYDPAANHARDKALSRHGLPKPPLCVRTCSGSFFLKW